MVFREIYLSFIIKFDRTRFTTECEENSKKTNDCESVTQYFKGSGVGFRVSVDNRMYGILKEWMVGISLRLLSVIQ